MSNQPETNETPATGYTPAPRKVGLPRFFELLGRDLWAFYRASFLCLLGFLPGTALAVFGQMGGSALLTVLGGLLGGLLGGPFLSGMIDTTLRALRDEPGYWWHTYQARLETKLEAESAARCAAGPVCRQLELMAPRPGRGGQHQHDDVGRLAGGHLCLHRLFSWLLARCRWWICRCPSLPKMPG